MDIETVDHQFSTLQSQGQQTATLIQLLADKLSCAAASGDPNAREWRLDLKEIALAIRDEQSTTTELLQSIRAVVDNHVTATATAPAAPPPAQPPAQLAQLAQPQQHQAPLQPQYQPAPASGGSLHGFLGGAFGQAIVTGVGFGIGEEIVESIFDSF